MATLHFLTLPPWLFSHYTLSLLLFSLPFKLNLYRLFLCLLLHGPPLTVAVSLSSHVLPLSGLIHCRSFNDSQCDDDPQKISHLDNSFRLQTHVIKRLIESSFCTSNSACLKPNAFSYLPYFSRWHHYQPTHLSQKCEVYSTPSPLHSALLMSLRSSPSLQPHSHCLSSDPYHLLFGFLQVILTGISTFSVASF